MDHVQLMSVEEQKIRKRWLLWFVKIPLVFYTLIALFTLAAIIIDFHLDYFLMLLGGSALIYALIYIPYYCAYKHQGTIYLTLILIFIPLQIVVGGIEL